MRRHKQRRRRRAAAVPDPVLGDAERAGTLIGATHAGHEPFVQREEQCVADGLTAPNLRNTELQGRDVVAHLLNVGGVRRGVVMQRLILEHIGE